MDVPSTTKLKKTRKIAKMTNLMTSQSDDDVIGGTSNLSKATCQTIIFHMHMCGLPLLYFKKCGHNLTARFLALGKPSIYISGRWQAPAAVLPEGPKDKVYGHSRARRARECPKHASPRARGRAKLNARLGACQCYYVFL